VGISYISKRSKTSNPGFSRKKAEEFGEEE
jgi:hypothetical protein